MDRNLRICMSNDKLDVVRNIVFLWTGLIGMAYIITDTSILVSSVGQQIAANITP